MDQDSIKHLALAMASAFVDGYLEQEAPMKTLHCMHKEDWMCEECCRCPVCCSCSDTPGQSEALVHVNSLAAANAWRRTTQAAE